MTDKRGDFVWYELMTPDVDAAQKFYGGLLGWEFADGGQPDMEYLLASKNGTEVAGFMTLTDEMTEGGAQPLWAGYVGVNDVDASAKDVTTLGGTVMLEPQDIPNVGRFAFLADPQGAPIYLMSLGEGSEAFAKHDPRDGHCAWNELVTDDPTSAKAFYTSLFGWEKDSEMDMGPMGLYEMFKTDDYAVGAIMKKPEMMPASLWVYYFRVPNIDAAADFVKASGGQVLTGPMEIPGGDHIINGMDPQGAFFALIGSKG
ncbi:VOC family protein [Pontixanthobacter sp. CEM42]|uniref:VOC family protein n=1 Tax=Pontixanthobacter sp. CEM42 TaxID=2792077 RepID=UPI001ADEE53D|nr:VOC family protein [Pontixanthobacter sp. CEM42]